MTLRDLFDALGALPKQALDAPCVAAIDDDVELIIDGPIEYSRGIVSLQTEPLTTPPLDRTETKR